MKKRRYVALTVGSTIPGVGWGPGPNKKKKVCRSPAFISPLSNCVATWPAASLSSRCAPPWWTVCLPIRSQNKSSFFKLLWLDVFLQQQEKQLMHKAQAAPRRDNVEKPTVVVTPTLSPGKFTVSKEEPVPTVKQVTFMLGKHTTSRARNESSHFWWQGLEEQNRRERVGTVPI